MGVIDQLSAHLSCIIICKISVRGALVCGRGNVYLTTGINLQLGILILELDLSYM